MTQKKPGMLERTNQKIGNKRLQTDQVLQILRNLSTLEIPENGYMTSDKCLSPVLCETLENSVSKEFCE